MTHARTAPTNIRSSSSIVVGSIASACPTSGSTTSDPDLGYVYAALEAEKAKVLAGFTAMDAAPPRAAPAARRDEMKLFAMKGLLLASSSSWPPRRPASS